MNATEKLRLLAEVGARLCCYAPGAGNPEKWPESFCDCKYLPVGHGAVDAAYLSSEQTGCCEVRAAWRALNTLRQRSERAEKSLSVTASDREACAEDGHMTARRSHETAWGEPVSPLVQSPDFCFRCGGTDVSFDWRQQSCGGAVKPGQSEERPRA